MIFCEEYCDLWHDRAMPAGVNWDMEAQIELLQRIAPHCSELLDVPAEVAPGPPSYGLLRDQKPRRVEVTSVGHPKNYTLTGLA
jgi:hypothetical protein